MRSLVPISLSVLLVVPALSLSAQQAAPAGATQQAARALPLVPGSRVKVSAATLVTPLLANFLEMRGDTAVFIEDAAGRGLWTFTVEQITNLEVSQGEKRGNWGYIGKSALVGAPIGTLLFWGTTGIIKPSRAGYKFNRTTTALEGLAVGTALGALIGTRFASERWMSLPLPRKVSLSPRARGGFDVGFDFTF